MGIGGLGIIIKQEKKVLWNDGKREWNWFFMLEVDGYNDKITLKLQM